MAKHGGKDKRVPEGFVEIPLHPKYFINREGQVWSSRRGKLLKLSISKVGYIRVSLSQCGWKYIHRLLAQIFLDNKSQLPVINHIDGNKLNNKLDNLEWCTQKHNLSEAVRIGLRLRSYPKLSVSDVISVRNLLSKGSHTQREIAAMYNVDQSTISDILRKKSRSDIKAHP